ncbi:hypothetical protein [Halalkalibacter oceani]|uniref:hypothetical protein n=1 Tax=Halalkalibacter oceani TaxID=1653776 RepID=UPI0033932FF6
MKNIKAFRKYNNGSCSYEVVEVNTNTGNIFKYNYNIVDGSLVRFSEWETSITALKWISLKSYFRRLKELGLKEFDLNEINLPRFKRENYSQEQLINFVRLVRN